MASEPGAMTEERLAEIEKAHSTYFGCMMMPATAEYLVDRVPELLAALRASRAREQELRQALAPFALAADCYDGERNPSDHSGVWNDRNGLKGYYLTIGDLRRARNASVLTGCAT